jgi:hypothetical protein
MARTLMILGTHSHAGSSMVTSGPKPTASSLTRT